MRLDRETELFQKSPRALRMCRTIARRVVALHLPAVETDAPSRGYATDLRHDVGHGRIARGVVASANVERELATPRNDIDGAVAHRELTHRADEHGRLRTALFNVEQELGRG